MATEQTAQNQRSGLELSTTAFDAASLVSKKPSSVPAIYEYSFEHPPTSPQEIQQSLNVSKSVTFSALDKLRRLELITRQKRGEYEPADITLDPPTVHELGQLRSQKQLEICRFAHYVDTFVASDLAREFDGSRSTLRQTAVHLRDKQFLHQRWEPFGKSPQAFQVTEQAERALSVVEVEDYLGRDGLHVSPHTSGIEGTAFRTAYEIEDAHYITQVDRPWVRPEEISSALDKNRKKTQRRLADMTDRGLLASKALREKMVFGETEKTASLMRDLRLYTVSKLHELDVYSIAKQTQPNELMTLDDLYSSLNAGECSLTPQTLASAIEDLKRADLIEGNSMSGYRFLHS